MRSTFATNLVSTTTNPSWRLWRLCLGKTLPKSAEALVSLTAFLMRMNVDQNETVAEPVGRRYSLQR